MISTGDIVPSMPLFERIGRRSFNAVVFRGTVAEVVLVEVAVSSLSVVVVVLLLLVVVVEVVVRVRGRRCW